MPETPEYVMSRKKESGGCGSMLMTGCTVIIVGFIVFLLGFGIYAYYKAEDWTRDSAAYLLEHAAQAGVKQLKLPTKEEEEKILVPVRELAGKIRAKQVSPEQAKAIATAVMESPAILAILCRTAELQYLNPSGLSEKEKTSASADVNRFLYALISEKVDKATLQSLKDIAFVEVVGQNQPQLKEKLTDEELRQALGIIKDAAEKAGVTGRQPPFDLGDAIRKAIDKGMSTAASSGAAPQTDTGDASAPALAAPSVAPAE